MHDAISASDTSKAMRSAMWVKTQENAAKACARDAASLVLRSFDGHDRRMADTAETVSNE
jgi:hypothetical protein